MGTVAMRPDRNCLWDDDTLERYCMRALPEGEFARLEEHLLICEVCQSRLADAENFADAMRHAALQICGESKGSWWTCRLLPSALAGLAAALILAAALHWVRPVPPAPALAVKLEALRGAQPGSQAPAGTRLTVEADLTGLPPAPSYRLQLVDREGRRVWSGSTASPEIAPLRPGPYFLRVYGGDGALLREYGLQVQPAP